VKRILEALSRVDWIGLGFELGLGLFILVSFVRCAFKG
jgi:hypothetical protein